MWRAIVNENGYRIPHHRAKLTKQKECLTKHNQKVPPFSAKPATRTSVDAVSDTLRELPCGHSLFVR